MLLVEGAHAGGGGARGADVGLSDLWGSFFSRIEKKGAMTHPFRRGMFNRVGLNVDEPVPAAQVTPALLQERVAGLLARG